MFHPPGCAFRVLTASDGKPLLRDRLGLRPMASARRNLIFFTAQSPQAQSMKESEVREPETGSLQHLGGFFCQPIPGLLPGCGMTTPTVRSIFKTLSQGDLE
jgi:hypothetical protein